MNPLPQELIEEFRRTAEKPIAEGNAVMVAIAHHYGLSAIDLSNVGKYWNYLLGLMRDSNPDWWRAA